MLPTRMPLAASVSNGVPVRPSHRKRLLATTMDRRRAPTCPRVYRGPGGCATTGVRTADAARFEGPRKPPEEMMGG